MQDSAHQFIHKPETYLILAMIIRSALHSVAEHLYIAIIAPNAILQAMNSLRAYSTMRGIPFWDIHNNRYVAFKEVNYSL